MSSEVDDLLRAYRKAMRTNDVLVAVTSLQRLSEIDKSRDWTTDLQSAERSAQRRILEKFKEAQGAGRSEESQILARQLIDTDWRERPAGHDIDEVLKCLAAEPMSTLRECRDVEWNRNQASSALKEIERLANMGLTLSHEEQSVVEGCRQRCEEELAAEAKEKKWHELCEQLHGAIQREEVAEIRRVLAEPEFLDREPDPELIRAAQMVVGHDEDSKRRKMMMVAGILLCIVLAVIGMSGWWFKQRRFDERCEQEAVRLASFEKGPHAIERLQKTLQVLESEEPDLFGDPRVNVFTERLRTLVEKNTERTNEIAMAMLSLQSMRDSGWNVDKNAVTSELERVKALLKDEDGDMLAEWRNVKKAWNDHVAAEDGSRRTAGTEAGERIIAVAESQTKRLSEEICRDGDSGDIDKCRVAITSWREKYAETLPEIDAKIAAVEKRMARAVQMQKHLHEAIGRLNGATTVSGMISARKDLTDNYGEFKAVGNLQPLPFTDIEASAVMDGSTASQKAFTSMFQDGVPEERFKAFVTENVGVIANIPALYSLYGLSRQDGTGRFFAVAIGKPSAENKPKGFRIKGKLLDFARRTVVDEIDCGRIRCSLDSLPLSDELKEVLEIVERGDVSPALFEHEVLKRIDQHVKEAHKKDFLKTEELAKDNMVLMRGAYPAYCRVQMLDIYLRWLGDDLKLMPDVPELTEWKQKVSALATSVKVDGIEDGLTWACLWETRVRRRNVECARLLARIPQTWTTTYKSIRSEMRELRRVGKWRVQAAGIVRFDPVNPEYAKDPTVVLPGVFPSVSCDHPLYVLRMANGKEVLKRALVPHEGRWARTAAMGRDYIPGEPLFHVIAGDVPIDAEAQIVDLERSLKMPSARRLLGKLPFFSPIIDTKGGHKNDNDQKQ